MMCNLFSTRDLTGCVAAQTPGYKARWKMERTRKGFLILFPPYSKESCRDRVLVAFSVWDTDGDGFLSWEVK